MKKLLFILSILILSAVGSVSASAETLKYVVTYKWGLIHKDAGDVVITKKPSGSGYELKLVAKSKPWADKIYKLRDTLISVTGPSKYKPIQYTYIAHEKNKYRRDNIKFTYSGNTVRGQSEKFKEEKDGKVTRSTSTMEATGAVYDMLSVYFYLRELDYASMKKGDKVRATIFSGFKKEQLEIKFDGLENIKLQDKSEHEAYHITFKFTQEGGKKSSDDINCWVSTKPSRIPLLIVGNLPVGQIRVNYVE